MARKASKKAIAEHLEAFGPWREQAIEHINKHVPEKRRPHVIRMVDEVRQRIESGEIGECTRALATSIVREVANWKEGHYTKCSEDGGSCFV